MIGDSKGSAAKEEFTAAQVRAMVAARGLRRDYLGFEASDAAWAMMLELYAARLEGRRVHQTMLCTAAGVPQATASQVSRKLIGAGLVLSSAHPDDKRLLIVKLSDVAAARIRAYLSAARGIIDAA